MRLTAAQVDLDAGTVTRDGEVHTLLHSEVALLRYLSARPGQPVSRDELLTEVWGYRGGVKSRTVDTTIKTLRRKIEADPSKPDHVRSVRGVGYCFEAGTAAATTGNLPRPSDRFFGRDAELVAVVAAFAGSDRLVSLVGPGGIGKTRLSLRVAERLASVGGAWFCDLAAATTATDVLAVVAGVLDVSLPARGDRVAAVGRALAGLGDALVVLDNTEGLDEEACATVGRLLPTSDARFLVTTRRPLRVGGERRIEVSGLSEDDAVALLVDRGRRVRADFGSDRDALVRIAEALEGVPLALELAAARAGTLSAAVLAERITGTLAWLDRGPADAPDRHRTLTATIRWTWDLLPDAHRAALIQCATFVGGFTAEAAEAVLDVDGRALDAVEALREWSLLTARAHPDLDQVRLRLFEAVRAFVLEEAPPDASAWARHAAWALPHARALAGAADEHGGAVALRRLDAERENLLAVIRHGAPDDGARASLVLDRVFIHRGLFRERLGLHDRAVALATSPYARSEAHRLRADARFDAGAPGVDDDLAAALDAALELGDRHAEGRVLGTHCTIRLQQGRLDEAAAVGQQALALVRSLGDEQSEAVRLSNLGQIHHRAGRIDAAEASLRAALAIHRRLGNQTNEGKVLGHLGGLYEELGQLDEAARCFRRALESHRAVGYGPGVLRIEASLGLLAANRGHFEDARDAMARAVAEARRTGDVAVEGVGLMYQARAELNLGRPTEAVDRAEEARQVLARAGLALFEALALGVLGAARALGGRAALAEAALSDGLELAESTGDPRVIVFLRLERAIARCRAGSLDAAAAELAAAEALLVGVEDPNNHAFALLARALLAVAGGDSAVARDVLAAVGPLRSDRCHALAAELLQGSAA